MTIDKARARTILANFNLLLMQSEEDSFRCSNSFELACKDPSHKMEDAHVKKATTLGLIENGIIPEDVKEQVLQFIEKRDSLYSKPSVS